jgi:hypothetical protein
MNLTRTVRMVYAIVLLALFGISGQVWAKASARPSPPPAADGLSPTAQPATYEIDLKPFAIKGYRDLRFGMTSSEARQATASLFGPAVANALASTAVEPGFTALMIDGAPTPEIGPARLILVFHNDRLCAVNLEQIFSDQATPAQRQILIEHARTLAAGLEGRFWPPLKTVLGRPVGANDLLVFSGIDDLGNGAQVSLIGIDYTYTDKAGVTRSSPKATGAAALRVLIEQDFDLRSVLRPGDF